MADKASQLILNALKRAAAEPGGLPLFAPKGEPGLFPATSSARAIAERCRQDGYLQVLRQEQDSKSPRDICALSEKGLRYLLNQSDPKTVLEDFVRVLEQRQTQLEAVASQLDGLRKSIDGMHATVKELRLGQSRGEPSQNGHSANGKQHAPPVVNAEVDIAPAIAKYLGEWHERNPARDCALPDLYRETLGDGAALGRFHDALRQLHSQGKIALHPWTGPLYALPEPAFALLVGHEIAYYANAIG